ncbi:hypothetical protein BD626DRAFT_505415 [Schizophyllum amplum]|uniref:Uncharacterized protein n=1 Tax=Schizophyllum amplum TaxID=97359 RepID=A0A550C6P6_9AGAR|nr:hypothetical protein BD626DRAFT_505415 [Auriculariopsis ampla]
MACRSLIDASRYGWEEAFCGSVALSFAFLCSLFTLRPQQAHVDASGQQHGRFHCVPKTRGRRSP